MSTAGARLLLIVGKGGVGRSTTAGAFAIRAVRSGSRVLLVDAVAAGGAAAAIGLGKSPRAGSIVKVRTPDVVSAAADESQPEISLLELSTEASLDQWVQLNLRMPIAPRTIGPIARIFDYVAVAAPAVREILTIGKIAHEVRRGPWDLVVVDAPATGHVVELLAAPTALAKLIGFGPLASDTAWMSALLADDEITSAVAVTLAEELPATETIELLDRVGTETDVTMAGIVINRLPPTLTKVGRIEAGRIAETAPLGPMAAVALHRDRVAKRERAKLAELGLPLAEAVEDVADPLGAVLEALEAAPELALRLADPANADLGESSDDHG